MIKHTITCALLGATLLAAAPSWANAPNASQTCAPHEERTDKYRHLRALSLDLRGYPPSAEEYEALAEHDDVPEAWIDEWMAGPDFAGRVVRWHRGLLWNNVFGENFVSVSRSLRATSGRYWRGGRLAIDQRGANVPCADAQARLTDGTLVETPADLTRGELQTANGVEGWVWVEPYWAPGERIKVCAFDAREDAVTESGAACNARANQSSPDCGCGPNLVWCADSNARNAILRSFNAQVDRVVSWVIEEKRPYIELFTTNKVFLNGPLTYYWRHLYSLGSSIQNEPNPMDIEQLPGLDFTQEDTWEATAGGAHHAGVLTLPGYLMRFQTDRSRANQFFTKFRCQPFQPPNQGLALEGADHPDLQQRDGCKFCHALLEPAAAYWGRWRERSAGYLRTSDFPAQSAACKTCAETGRGCSTECRTHYIVDTSEAEMVPYAGYLNAYIFRKNEHNANVEQGPSLLAMTSVADNTLLSCVAQRSAESYLGRPLLPAEQGWLSELVATFSDSNYDYPSVLKHIVMSETYRRIQ